MSLKQQAVQGSEVKERMGALATNAAAVRAIASAVEGTLGPKGLDTMLVDRFGDVIITNDGVTILTRMEATHPAARMVINIAKAQEEEVGDGTTTATIMAGQMVSTGVELVARGVPVSRIIEGMRIGLRHALQLIADNTVSVEGLQDPRLRQVALVAGREHADIADLVAEAAAMVGAEKLRERNFKLADTVLAREGAENEVFLGTVINKQRMNRQMPDRLEAAKVLVVDDALEPEEVEDEALGTESGFARYIALQDEFRANIHKLVDLGVGLVLADRGVSDTAEEILTDAGVMVVQRVLHKELRRAAEHTGAKMIKRTGLKKPVEELAACLGRVELVEEDEKLEQIRLRGGAGKPMSTILVGAATEEVVDERERIAKDAAGAVQAAFKSGVVPGGGTLELWIARQVERMRPSVKGMAAHGVDCVVEALKRPMAQIIANAGFNPLEKIGDAVSAQAEQDSPALGIDTDTGQVVDMMEAGVVDPALVKTHALKAAGEIAEAILRIDTIIKKREDSSEENKGTNSDD